MLHQTHGDKQTDPAVGLYFKVKVDGFDLGSFTQCDGLSAEWEMNTFTEGGENSFVHQVPVRLKYSPIKLTRPIDARTPSLAAWFSQRDPYAITGLLGDVEALNRAATATIDAMDPYGKVITRWTLQDVFPTRWTGPSLSADGTAVAKETIELVHNGFYLATPPAPAAAGS